MGATAYRVKASFLPGPKATVAEKIEAFGMHTIDLTDGAVLEKGCVYIVPLMESLKLSSRIYGIANPKSSTGRIDIFTRLITDHTKDLEAACNEVGLPWNRQLWFTRFHRFFKMGGILVEAIKPGGD